MMSGVTRLPLLLCRPVPRISSALSPSYLSTSSSHQSKKSGGASGNTAGTASKAVDQKNYEPPSFVFKDVNAQDVGPGAGKDKDYKNPEYFSYHTMSYADMDIVMEKLRCPQPSSVKK